MPGLGHIAIGVAAGRFCVRDEADRGRLAVAMTGFAALSMLPDADVIAFSLGIPYGAPFGHRGALHSVAAGLALGLLAGLLGRVLGQSWLRVAVVASLVAVSHGLLDTLTDGGRGIAVLWPLSEERYFAPWQPIPVSPLGWAVLSEWGLRIMRVELLCSLPLLLYAFWPRRRGSARIASAFAHRPPPSTPAS